MYHIKKYLKDLKRLRAGTYRDTKSGLFLDRNERSMPYSPEIIMELHTRIQKIHLGLYPEMVPFYNKLSNWLGIPKNQIYVTEGVSGAIKSLIETLTIPSKHTILFPFPTFAMYPVYCNMFNVKAKMIGYNSNYKLEKQKLFDMVDYNTAILFLPNPNMPIEGTLNINELRSLAEHCNKTETILAIDEVYYPYGGPTAIELIDHFDNVFVMRSFSKAFGLASIRVGFLLGSETNIDYVSKTRTGYETNSISMEIATFFIDNYDYILDYVKQVTLGLQYIKTKLNDLNIEYNGGDTGNFIYVNMKSADLANAIVESLRHENIYVRGGWPKPYDTGFTITGAPQDMMEIFYNKFYNSLTSLISENKFHL